MKRRYELTVIFSSQLSSTEHSKAVKKLETLLKKQEGKVVKKDDWGKRQLAYPIQKETEGVYTHFVVELVPDSLEKLRQEFELTQEMLRYLFVIEGI